METDEPVYQGFLLLPPSGKILKKSWQKKYGFLYKRSSSGVARMEIYETDTKTGQAKIITLEDVIKITPKPPNAFNILTKSTDQDFGTVTDDDLNIWFRAIQNVAFPDVISQITSIQEDNDLYCSTDEGVFYVKVYPSEAAKRCQIANKNCTLVLTTVAIQLRTDVDGKLLYTWPFCFIRRYGYKNGKFTFEAGRKCESGEGIFFLEHPNQYEIYRCLASKMKNMKKLLNSESTSSLLDCGDIQFHPALSMEARSRSPLPTSPTTMLPKSSQNSFSDSNLQSSRSHFSLSNSSIESMSIVKPLPKKPPRKSLLHKDLSKPVMPVVTINMEHNYQDATIDEYLEGTDDYKQDKYDIVESRREAWRTLGIEEPSHSEQSLEKEEYISWGLDTLTKSTSKITLIETTHAPAVINEPNISLDDQSYDHLNFFGSSSRLNVSSGYKQVVPPPLPPVSVSSNNVYDEVQVMEPARSADDSHLGYALVRKDAVSGTFREIEKDDVLSNTGTHTDAKQESKTVSHRFHNDEPYAVISKPKRV